MPTPYAAGHRSRTQRPAVPQRNASNPVTRNHTPTNIIRRGKHRHDANTPRLKMICHSPRQHPENIPRRAQQHQRQNRPRNPGRKKLRHCHVDHLVRHPGMKTVGPRQHLRRDQRRTHHRCRQPQRNITHRMRCSFRNPPLLHHTGNHRQQRRRRKRQRPISPELRRPGHLPPDIRISTSARLRSVIGAVHFATQSLHFAPQSVKPKIYARVPCE